MKTLEEHNEEARKSLQHVPNDIKCPNCEKNGSISELVDDLHAPILLTHPAQIKIFCLQCDFQSYRYA